MPDPDDYNTGIIEEFRANRGKVGGYFDGATLLILHTKGIKSGQPRVKPLVYLPDGERFVVFGTKGGAPTDPFWVRNVLADPEAAVELGDRTVPVQRGRHHRPRRRRALRAPGGAPARVRRVQEDDLPLDPRDRPRTPDLTRHGQASPSSGRNIVRELLRTHRGAPLPRHHGADART